MEVSLYVCMYGRDEEGSVFSLRLSLSCMYACVYELIRAAVLGDVTTVQE